MTPLRTIVIALYLILCAGIVVFSYSFAYRANLNRLAESGDIRAAQVSDRLLAQLDSFRMLVNILTDHPQVSGLFRADDNSGGDANGDTATVVGGADEFLINTALSSGAEEIAVLDAGGQLLAGTLPRMLEGVDIAQTGFFRAAMTGSLGFLNAVDPETQARRFMFARGVHRSDGPPRGVVVVSLDIAEVEFEWNIDEMPIAIFDDDGIIYVTNRPSLSLLDTGRRAGRLYQGETNLQGLLIWTGVTSEALPGSVLVRARRIHQLHMDLRVFLDIAPARRAALTLSALAAAGLMILGLGYGVLAQRRRRLVDLLAIEEAANSKLEARVEQRTAELRNTQDQLVQAGKMTALGQLSASISHELNQPLATIRNFAENGQKLLSRSRFDKVQENLAQITSQIDRATRIIRNLRAFSRNETEPTETLDINTALDAALALARTRLKEEQINLTVHRPETPLFVAAGQVRLQQVILNLITNAMDALAAQSDRALTLTLTRSGADIQIIVRDNGPGIDDDARVFEPFYSTKEVGSSKGLGLGLSISYGIVGSFGGTLSCRNHPAGGAEFTITLPEHKLKDAA